VIVVTLAPQSTSQERNFLLDRKIGQQPITGWLKRLRGHDVYSYRSTITTVICTHQLELSIFILVARMTVLSPLFATSFTKVCQPATMGV
jgi:hypothetical protein